MVIIPIYYHRGAFVLLWLIRAAAYGLSGLTIWSFFQGGTDSSRLSAIHQHLALDSGQGMVFGVCAGISNYTGLDVTIIRLAWVVSAFYKGLGIGLYILAFLLMPMN